MRVIVCGGRQFSDASVVNNALELLLETYPDTLHVCTGGATGADSLATTWARRSCIPYTTFIANWDLHGNKAGPIRNVAMLERFRPHLVLATAGGSGTAHMTRIAEQAGVPVVDLPATAAAVLQAAAAGLAIRAATAAAALQAAAAGLAIRAR